MHQNGLFYQGGSSLSQAREALVTVAIETALLVAGSGVHKRVSDLLADNYDCTIIDCYKHPQYLTAVLSRLEKVTRDEIISAIRKELSEYSYVKAVSSFLGSL